jgi:hypothetical protein
LSVFNDVIGQKLQGDKSVEGYVLGLIDDTHAAATELLDNVVMRDGPADHSGDSGIWSPHLTDAATASQRMTGAWCPVPLSSPYSLS